MSLEQKLEAKVEAVLQSDSVDSAGRFMSSRSGTVMIAIISFIESALPVPILTDPFLVAAILADRSRVVRLVMVTTIASVAGGLCAYFAAAFFFEVILQWLTPGMSAQFSELVAGGDSGAFMLTIIGAITPIPYTIVAWVVAVLEGGLAVFIAASVLGRGFRYAVVGYSTYRFGALAVAYAKRYLGLTSLIVVVLALLFVWHKM